MPYLVHWLRAHHDSGQVSGAFLRATVLTTSAIAVVLLLFLPVVVASSSLSAGARQTCFVASLGLLPYLFAASIAGYWSGLLTAREQFIAPAISPIARTIVVVTFVTVAGRSWGVWSLVVGYVIGEVLRAEALRRRLPAELKQFSIARSTHLPEGYGHFLLTARAQVLGAAVLALTAVIDRAMVASVGPGAVSVLEYAERLWQVPAGLLLAGYLAINLTAWSRQHQSSGNARQLADDVRRSAWRVSALLVVPCVLVAVFHEEVVAAIFRGGGLDASAVTALARVLGLLVLVTPVFAAGLVYVRGLFVLRRSDLVLRVNLVQTVVKIALNLVLIPRYGLLGAALATCAMYIVSTLLVAVMLHRTAATSPSAAALP